MREREALRRPSGQGGYSLVELVAAMAIFALVFAAVSLGIGRALDLNRNSRNRSTAAYLAAQELEEVRSKPFDQVALGQTTCSYQTTSCNLPSPYTVTREVSWVAPATTSSSCNVPNGSSGAALAYKRVTVRVTWDDMRVVNPVTSQTLLTPPIGAYDPYDGHVAVQLFDRTAAPLVGQTVRLSGPESATQVSTGDGCVFFAYLDPGTYTVSLSTSGYVDRQGNQPATQTASVAASQITTLQFDYDRAATLEIGLVAPSGAVIPSGIATTVANSNLTVGTKSFPEASTGSGVSRTVTPLFPYSSGYQVWAGECEDADPGFHPGGSRGAALASNPGGTASGSATLDAVDVVVLRGGNGVAGATVEATHLAATGCPSGVTLTSTTTTDANGRLKLALPYGTWTIRATGSTTGVSTPILLDPVLPSIPSVTVVLP
jgi:prepilin-type N-terminal cleavage/methylation domain-containing protein